jgi:hypothetical protein
MSKLIRVLAPLVVGLALGAAAGVFVVFGARVLSLGFTDKQDLIAALGFSVLGGVFGLADSAQRLSVWFRDRAARETATERRAGR